MGAVRGHILEFEGPRGVLNTGKSSCMCKAVPEGNPAMVRPQGKLREVLDRVVGTKENRWWRAPRPAKGGYHEKQPRGCEITLRPWPPSSINWLYNPLECLGWT